MKIRRILAANPIKGFAATELRIFRSGSNPCIDGSPLLFDAVAATAVMDALTKRGIKLHFDYGHALPASKMHEDMNPEWQKAAGWFDLEVRDTENGKELWAINIQWTPAAKKAIEDLEWGYFSPWVYVEEASRRVVEILNIALTNDPAMIEISPLMVAADRRQARKLASSGLSFEDISEALRNALIERYPETWPFIEAVYDDCIVYSIDGVLYRVGYTIVGTEVVISNDVEEVIRSYVTVPAPPPPEIVEANRNSRSAFDYRTKTAQNAQKTPGVQAPLSNSGVKGKAMQREELMLALGLRTDAPDADVHNASAMVIEQLISTTKARNAAEALGKIEGWSKAARNLEDAQAKLVQLEREARDKSVDDLIAKGVKENKITVGMQANLRAIGQDDPDRLRGLIEALPVVLALCPSVITDGNQGNNTATSSDKKWEELTYSQKAQLKKKNPNLANALIAEHQSRMAV